AGPATPGRSEAGVAVDGLVVEPALVAQPALIDGVTVNTEVARDAVAGTLHGHPATHRARGARALDLLEVPRPRLEAVGSGGEGADGADLHGVAREVGRERFVGEGVDLDG